MIITLDITLRKLYKQSLKEPRDPRKKGRKGLCYYPGQDNYTFNGFHNTYYVHRVPSILHYKL